TRRYDAGVMAGGDEVGAQLPAVLPQAAELQPAVADDARVRRPPGQVLVGEVVDDAAEVLFEIEGVKGEIESVGDAAGGGGRGRRRGRCGSPSCGRRGRRRGRGLPCA